MAKLQLRTKTVDLSVCQALYGGGSTTFLIRYFVQRVQCAH